MTEGAGGHRKGGCLVRDLAVKGAAKSPTGDGDIPTSPKGAKGKEPSSSETVE